MATPLRPDHAPIARARSAGMNDASKIARLPGVSSAAPAPGNTRVTMRNTAPGANSHAAEASANPDDADHVNLPPAQAVAELPADQKDAARASVYPFINHCS